MTCFATTTKKNIVRSHATILHSCNQELLYKWKESWPDAQFEICPLYETLPDDFKLFYQEIFKKVENCTLNMAKHSKVLQ